MPNALATRMAELDATAEEVAALIGREAAKVADWIDVDTDAEPDPDAAVRLRPFLADAPAAAGAALDRLRRRYSRSLAGDGAMHAKVAVPYGTADVGLETGGVPK